MALKYEFIGYPTEAATEVVRQSASAVDWIVFIFMILAIFGLIVLLRWLINRNPFG